MSEARQGFVSRVFKKEGTSSKGPWYAFSFKIEDPEGNEDPKFYQLGFNVDCPFKEGDYLKFQADPKDDKAMTVVPGSGDIITKNLPQRAEKKSSGGGKGRGGYGGGAKTTKSDLFGDIGGYNTEDDIRRMSWSASRTQAIDLVGLLLEHDGLPMSVAKGKASQPKRFEAITAAVDKLTVEFFYDAATGRKLETVADGGEVNLDADGALPDQTETATPDTSENSTGAETPPDVDDGDTSGSF